MFLEYLFNSWIFIFKFLWKSNFLKITYAMQHSIPYSIPSIGSRVTYHSPNGFGRPKYVCGLVRFPKYVCFVARLGKQLLEKQVLKIVINLLWQNGINSCQYNTAWAILLFVSRTRFWCLLVPLNITPHHARVSCLIIGLTINATE